MLTIPGFLTWKDLYRRGIFVFKLKHENGLKPMNVMCVCLCVEGGGGVFGIPCLNFPWEAYPVCFSSRKWGLFSQNWIISMPRRELYKKSLTSATNSSKKENALGAYQ
jgi:hypothetical protein